LHFPPPIMADFLLMLSHFMSLDGGLRRIEVFPTKTTAIMRMSGIEQHGTRAHLVNAWQCRPSPSSTLRWSSGYRERTGREHATQKDNPPGFQVKFEPKTF